MYFILTVSLVLVLLHSRLGDSQLPYECRMANSSVGEGVTLELASCKTSLIEVTYRRVEPSFADTLSIIYTCQYPNGTEVFENDQALIRSANFQSGTIYIRENSWTQHGIVCDFYTCYSFQLSEFSSFMYAKTSAVTCTVVDIDVCTKECLNSGAIGCKTDTLTSIGPSHLGYGCTCAEGYAWNSTHCENVDECNITKPDYQQQQHNCSVEDGYQCVDVEGSYVCVHCTDRDKVWNGTSCISQTNDSIHAIDNLTSEMGMSTEGAILATVATVSFFVLSLIGFLSVVFYLCTCSKKRKNKSVHTETSYYSDYPSYPGYADKIDMNFEPIKSTDNLSSALPSLSIESRLNRLWEKDLDSYTSLTGATTLHHVTTSSIPQHHQSSETSSSTNLSSHMNQCGQSIDQYENYTEQHTDSVEPLLSTITNHPPQKYSEEVNQSPTETSTPMRQLQHRFSCVTLESSASACGLQTNGHHFHLRQSSVCTVETDYAIGTGLTDTSGYVMCVKADHSEDEKV